MHITIIAGARPNFMKISPIIREIIKQHKLGVSIDYRLVHTGQHFDSVMSETFFKELNIPKPDINLMAGGGTQAEQTATIMVAFEKYLLENPTDLVLVVGDVTSTMACSIVAKKMNIKLAHVEGGIRSYDNTMPEEINRKVTDSITDYFFTTTTTANDILFKEGHSVEKLHLVGNVMIDTLLYNIDKLVQPSFFQEKHLELKKYIVLTLHRPNNVDDFEKLAQLLTEISNNVHGLPVLFPAHPRTLQSLKKINSTFDNLIVIPPLGYLEFNYLVKNSMAVITDSGGITEETTVMKVPCMTLRDNTERPETCSIGTNELIGTNPANIKPALDILFSGKWKKGGIPELWDGKSSERIIAILISLFKK